MPGAAGPTGAGAGRASPPDDSRPVGIFDSGVGGLSVLRAIRRDLPAEDLLYVADSRHAPYGDRPSEFIEARALAIFDFFRSRQVKAGVIACNTATAAAVATLRARHDLPIVAMEPAVKPAVTQTRTGIVGVLATTRTLASAKFLKLVDQYGSGASVIIQPCPGLVEQVERGDLHGEVTRAMVRQHVLPVLARGADTIVLGCTHYPFLRDVIQEIAGPEVVLIDPAVAVARELRRRLTLTGILADAAHAGTEQFWSSDAAAAGPVIAQLWGGDPHVHPLP